MTQPTTKRGPVRGANPPHERITEARSRFLFNGVDGDVLAHRPDPARGDLVVRLRVRGDAARLGIGRVSPAGELREILVHLDEIAQLVSACAEYRLRVAPTPPPDDPRGRRRGAR